MRKKARVPSPQSVSQSGVATTICIYETCGAFYMRDGYFLPVHLTSIHPSIRLFPCPHVNQGAVAIKMLDFLIKP